jgi:hypothetical protein
MATMAQVSTVTLIGVGATASAPAPQASGGQLEWGSLIIGFMLGLLFALALYMLRDRIAAARAALRDRIARLRARLSRRGIDRYRDQIIELAERGHLLHRYGTLSELYVERRLLVPGAVPAALKHAGDDPDDGRWSGERTVDLMHRAAVSVTLSEAIGQGKGLAILGTSGSGRTTQLNYLALLYARGVGWRLSLPEPQGQDSGAVKAARRREQERLPVVVPLQAVDLALIEEGGRNALSRPIVAHLAASPYHAISAYGGSLVRSRLVTGDCLLLFDNLDLLDPERRGQALDWIGALVQAYPDNMVVVCGAIEGYAALAKVDLVPLILDAFGRAEVARFVERWERIHDHLDASELEDERASWQATLEQAGQDLPPEALAAPAAEHTAAPELPLSVLDAWSGARQQRVWPIDLALAAILWRQAQPVPDKVAARYAQAVIAAIGHVEDSLLTPSQWAQVLSSVAWSMQVEGQHQEAQSLFEQAVTDLLEDTYVASADLRTDEEDERPGFSRESRDAMLALLAAGDLLVEVERRRIAFVHPMYRAYFAAQHAARARQESVMRAHVRDPQWQHTVRFYAALSDPAPLVQERLRGTDDLFHSDLIAAAGDVAAATSVDKRLRQGLLSELAQILLDPKHPTPLRQEAAATIAQFQDDGVLYLFGKATAHQDPLVRRMGVWGLSLLDGERAWSGLQHALSDHDHMVRIEALYALSQRHGEATLDGLVQGLQDEHELTRRVAAELLAHYGGDGHDLLREAAGVEDMYIRRAAVFGLSTIDQPWALQVVDHVQREDEEWFVRSAAAEVMERALSPQTAIAPQAVRPELEEWLARWASEQGIPCATPDEANDALLQAMRQGSWWIRVAAADLLRACGGRQAIPLLKGALRDEQLLVREAAYAALWEIGQRLGQRILA